MSKTNELAEIFEAIIFAARKHEGQVRKDESRSPYITHPISVAKAAYQIGGVSDTLTLTAAILHDTIEDTQTTEAEIQKHFGADILALVLELTDDKSLDKATRKQLQVIHAPHLSQDAKVIKLADKLINCCDILESPPRKWNLERRQDYIQWAADVVAQLRGTNTGLENAFDEMLSDAERKLNITIEPFETVHQRPWSPYTADQPDQA